MHTRTAQISHINCGWSNLLLHNSFNSLVKQTVTKAPFSSKLFPYNDCGWQWRMQASRISGVKTSWSQTWSVSPKPAGPCHLYHQPSKNQGHPDFFMCIWIQICYSPVLPKMCALCMYEPEFCQLHHWHLKLFIRALLSSGLLILYKFYRSYLSWGLYESNVGAGDLVNQGGQRWQRAQNCDRIATNESSHHLVTDNFSFTLLLSLSSIYIFLDPL